MSQLAKQKVLAVIAAVALLAGGLFWALSRGDTLGEMTLRVEKGSAEIQRGDEIIRAAGETDVAPGDVVSTGSDSQATLRLEGQRLLYLDSEASLEILGTVAVASRSGTMIAKAGDSLKVSLGDTVARGQKAVFRVDREVGTTRAGVYTGRVDLSAPGSPGLRLDALWQTTLVADRLYDAEPYELGERDQWDEHYLDELVELNEQLKGKKNGYIGEIAGTAPTLSYFGSLVNDDVGFLRRYVRDLSPRKPGYTADVMIGLFLARQARGSLEGSFEKGFGYFRQGASWGISAGLIGLETEEEWRPAVAQLDRAMFATSGAGGGSEGPTFVVAGDDAGPGATVDGAPAGETITDRGGDTSDPGPQIPPPDDGDGDDGDGDDGDGDGDDGDDGDPSPPPEECDAQCEVEKILEPSPEPTDPPGLPPLGR